VQMKTMGHILSGIDTLKVYKHEIILIFFYLNQNLVCPRSIFKQNFASFPSIFARISMFEHFRDDWAYAEPNFFESYPKFFIKVFTLVLLDRFLDGFWIFYRQNLHFN